MLKNNLEKLNYFFLLLFHSSDTRIERKNPELSADDSKSSLSYLTRKKEKALKIVTQRGDVPQPD